MEWLWFQVLFQRPEARGCHIRKIRLKTETGLRSFNDPSGEILMRPFAAYPTLRLTHESSDPSTVTCLLAPRQDMDSVVGP